MENKYTEKDLRLAFKAGIERGAFLERDEYAPFRKPLDEDDYIESLKPQPKEEKEIPITYGLIKATCGWSEFCDVTGGNHYAINEWGDFEDREVSYITESQAKQLNFI